MKAPFWTPFSLEELKRRTAWCQALTCARLSRALGRILGVSPCEWVPYKSDSVRFSDSGQVAPDQGATQTPKAASGPLSQRPAHQSSG